jgi:hypothetical protein
MDKTKIDAHISRYFIAVYGKDVGFRAPETFPNLVERWMLAVARDDARTAELLMNEIESFAKMRQAGHGRP